MWHLPACVSCSQCIAANMFQSISQKLIANSADLDEMAHYEPSHQDLHCLLR